MSSFRFEIKGQGELRFNVFNDPPLLPAEKSVVFEGDEVEVSMVDYRGFGLNVVASRSRLYGWMFSVLPLHFKSGMPAWRIKHDRTGHEPAIYVDAPHTVSISVTTFPGGPPVTEQLFFNGPHADKISCGTCIHYLHHECSLRDNPFGHEDPCDALSCNSWYPRKEDKVPDKVSDKDVAEVMSGLVALVEKMMPGLACIAFTDFALLNDMLLRSRPLIEKLREEAGKGR